MALVPGRQVVCRHKKQTGGTGGLRQSFLSLHVAYFSLCLLVAYFAKGQREAEGSWWLKTSACCAQGRGPNCSLHKYLPLLTVM